MHQGNSTQTPRDIKNPTAEHAKTKSENAEQAVAKLQKIGVDTGALVAVIDPLAQVNLLNDVSTLMNPGARVSEQYRTGQFSGPALGVGEWNWTNNSAAHTTGSFTSATPLVNGAGQTGSSLVTDGWSIRHTCA